jgi:Ca-activated chloride channel family protein
MLPPKIEIIPARPAICQDQATSLDVLILIHPPVPEVHFLRPPINLGLVLDRSGSMAAQGKMLKAREAGSFAVSQLLPSDRVSITIFDDRIETIVPSEMATNKPALVAKIDAITARGSTDLHGGWAAGAAQVLQHVDFSALNRVLLLSDGMANVGLTDKAAISAEVRAKTAEHVSTTAMGVGTDYNEELMEAIADAGGGNYYFVESAVQLADIFQTELNGLMGTTGRDVGLWVEPGCPGIEARVMNDFERAGDGRFQLSDLIVGMPISVLVHVDVPPQSRETEICRVRLEWEEPGASSNLKRATASALALPAVSAVLWAELPIDPAVSERLTLHEVAQTRKEMIAAIDRGDRVTATALSAAILDTTQRAVQTAQIETERELTSKIAQKLEAGDVGTARKASHYQQYWRNKGRDLPPK